MPGRLYWFSDDQPRCIADTEYGNKQPAPDVEEQVDLHPTAVLVVARADDAESTKERVSSFISSDGTPSVWAYRICRRQGYVRFLSIGSGKQLEFMGRQR